MATIKGMPDDVGTTFLGNKVNAAAMLVMGHEDFKEIGVTQVGPLALLLGEITNLRQEKKSETGIKIDYIRLSVSTSMFTRKIIQQVLFMPVPLKQLRLVHTQIFR